MKTIKAILRKIKSKLTIQTFQKPLIVTLGAILFINIIILVVASIIANAIDVDSYYYSNVWDAFSKGAIKWMVAPNSILSFTKGSIYDGTLTLLCGLVVALEMILFSGIIIASTTTALKSYIDKKMSAKGSLSLENHIVVLNWNSKVPEIVLDLIESSEKNVVLILSNRDKDYINKEINSVILSSGLLTEKLKIQLIIRTGEPLLHSEMQDIAIDKAKRIFIMAREDMDIKNEGNITNADLFSLKIMMGLADFNMDKNARVVIETEDDNARMILEDLAKNVDGLKDLAIAPISFNRKLGQILAQVILEPSLATIYADLLSYKGSEFYSYADISVETYLDEYDSAVPIINFGKLYVLSENRKLINHKRDVKLTGYRKINILINEKEKEFLTIITIATNKKTPYLIENLNIYKKDNPDKFEMINCEKDEYSKLINGINKSKGKVKVLILSDDKAQMDSYDANVFLSLIALKNGGITNPNVSYITEILDSKNLNSIRDFKVQNAIISNRLISLLLVQMVSNDESKKFFEGLLTIDSIGDDNSFDIFVKSAENIFDFTDNLTFKTMSEFIRSFYYSCNKTIMPIGIIDNKEYLYFSQNLDCEWNYTIKKEDKIIYIKY